MFWYKYKVVCTVEVRNFLVDVQSGKLARQKCEISVSGIPTFLILEGNYIPPAQMELFYRNYHVCVSEGFQVSINYGEIFVDHKFFIHHFFIIEIRNSFEFSW